MLEHKPTSETRAEVSALVAFGITHVNIAKRLKISDETLRKHYDNELSFALDDANRQVANVLFSKAVDDRDLSAVIFWLKTRGRWRTTDKEDEGKDKQLISLIEQILELKKNV